MEIKIGINMKTLENHLQVSDLVNRLEKEFDLFVKKRGGRFRNELYVLRLVKVFMHKEQQKIESITSKSILSGSDCLTLSVICHLLIKRKGYDVRIGKSGKILRSLHSFVISHNGEAFNLAGTKRDVLVVKMDINDIITRLKYFNLMAGKQNHLFMR